VHRAIAITVIPDRKRWALSRYFLEKWRKETVLCAAAEPK